MPKVKTPQEALTLPPSATLSAENLISQAIAKSASVGTMERLLAMRDKLKAEWAREQFNRAMAGFQADCPTIEKTKVVSTNSGGEAYRYAPIESIVNQVKPFLQQYGFSYSSGMELLDDKVKVVIKVTHSDGHTETSEMTVPLGNKTNVMSASQVVAAAQTFAKRYAFCNAFGILTGDEDTDARSTPGIPPSSPQNPPSEPESPKPEDVKGSISPKQYDFIATLVTKHRENGEQYKTLEEFEQATNLVVKDLTSNQARKLIDSLLKRVKEIEANKKEEETPNEPVAEEK